MTSNPVHFALIGAGRIAQAYAEAFWRSEKAQIAAVVDVREAAAEALGEHVGCVALTDYQAIDSSTGLDAALVCTPPGSHPEICRHLIEQGTSVLCEKPLSIDVGSAHELVRAAEAAGVLFTMASKFRYVEDLIRAKSIVESGALGDIVLLENTFAASVDMSTRWNANPSVSGGGVLIDNGTHSVDLARYLLGPVTAVQAVAARPLQDLGVEDTVRLLLKCRQDVLASVDLSWSLDMEVDSYVDIYGAHGTVRVGWQESRFRVKGSPSWVSFGVGYDKIEAFRRQIDNFSSALRGDEDLLIKPVDALASVEVIGAAYTSLAESRWVELQSVATAAEVTPVGA